MPLEKTKARLTRAAQRLRAFYNDGVAALDRISRSIADGCERRLKQIRRTFRDLGQAIGDYERCGTDWCAANLGVAGRWSQGMLRMIAAFWHRYGYCTFYLVILAGVGMLGWVLWQDHVIGDLLTKANSDSEHANDYYFVNIVFLPFQAFLLLVGGLYAAWTLSQNHKFKQHDVEAMCVRDYVAIEQRLEAAQGDGPRTVGAIRAYWTLMVYEYYWWRRGLISRGLFTIWCEFRVQRFRDNTPYTFAADTFDANNAAAPFPDYQTGFAYCKSKKVFRSPSRFEDLMLYLKQRAHDDLDNLQWHEIERFRHGWRERF